MSISSNDLVNLNAREATDRFKMEVAREVGVIQKQGYNVNLTSKRAGSVGGRMVKNVLTVRLTKKAVFERENRIVDGHKQTVRYIAGIAI